MEIPPNKLLASVAPLQELFDLMIQDNLADRALAEGRVYSFGNRWERGSLVLSDCTILMTVDK